MDNNLNSLSSDPLYTLSVASKLSGIPSHSIRQYIDKNLILPYVTKTGRHLFSDVEIARLRNIKKHFSDDGLNLAGLKALYALIPCWAIKKCTVNDREDCGAYISTETVCWEAANKSERCRNSDCRKCLVYNLTEIGTDFKTLLKELIP